MPSVKRRRSRSPENKGTRRNKNNGANAKTRKSAKFREEAEVARFGYMNAPKEVLKAEKYLEKLLKEGEGKRSDDVARLPLSNEDRRRVDALVRSFKHEFPYMNLPEPLTRDQLKIVQEQLWLLGKMRDMETKMYGANVPQKPRYPREERGINLNIASLGHYTNDTLRAARTLAGRHIGYRQDAHERALRHRENMERNMNMD